MARHDVYLSEAALPWLVHDGKVLASVELADSVGTRSRGLLGRDHIEGAMVLEPARSVHTIRMKFAIDVAFLSGDRRVLSIVTMKPNRIGRPRWFSRSVIEAEAGSFARWEIGVGDQLEIRGGDE
ncbi:MAG: DUF192 domain-containing protein [Actinomycetes bacterium]